MLALWDEYVAQNGVILTDDGPFKAKAAPQNGVILTDDGPFKAKAAPQK